MESYPARIRVDHLGEKHVQSVAEHCRNVARYAAVSLEAVGLSATGRLAGLIHDAGKFSSAFRDYICRAAAGEQVRRGSVNHTFAGVRLLFERYFQKDEASLRNLACEIIAYAAGAHHGLFDGIDPYGKNGFAHRLDAEEIPYHEVKERFLAFCADTGELDALFEKAAEELIGLTAQCRQMVQTQEELLFHISLICRQVLSAVIDADRRDAAEFMCGMHFAEYDADMRPLWHARLEAVDTRLDELESDTPIRRARREISLQCRDFPADEGGIYRLSVPTGSGKTLAGLRFALQTAERHNKSRVFFVIPLLSVLEQNAKVIRDYLARDEIVLEHHSNLVRTEESEKLDENEHLVETWRSPVVMTTLVQLLNTLFRADTTCVRRFRALADSVIVIDEVQSLPKHMLTQFNLAVNFLAGACRATVVLCSATQPTFETAEHPMRFAEPRDIVAYDPALFASFSRTETVNLVRDGGYTCEEIAGFAVERLEEVRSILLICNKKDQAVALFQLLAHAGAEVFHLSTSMCMAHRKDTLAQINAALESGKRVICAATQLVEAGVDFSFGCVIRAFAGLDNIIQAAGRCNRGGEFGELRPVYIMNIRGEDLKKLKEIQQSQEAARDLFFSFERDRAAFDACLDSGKSIAYYYRRLFRNMRGLAQDYPAPKLGTTLFKMLAGNDDFRVKCANARFPLLGQAFKTAGTEFQVFDDSTQDVLVPYGEGEKLIEELCSERARRDLLYRKKLLDEAKSYTVSLFSYQVNVLTDAGGLFPVCDGAVLSVLPAFYRSDTGINLSGGTHDFQEV